MSPPVWIHGERRPGERFSPMDAAETARAGRLRDPAAAQDFLHARDLMRRLIAEARGVSRSGVVLQAYDDAAPQAQGFETTGISWSRSGHHAIAALMEKGRIGVDLECVVPRQTGALLDMIATSAERARINALGMSDAALAGFYRLWCTKEAVLKWRGTGLRGAAKSVEVPTDIIAGTATETGMDEPGGRLHLKVIQPSADWLAVLAFSD